MIKTRHTSFALAALTFIAVVPAHTPAAETTLLATDTGFFNEAGRSSKNDGLVLGATLATFNYSVGAIDEVAPLAGTDVKRRNYFTFDLSGITEPIVSAKLSAFNPVGGYGSPDATETYALVGAFASPPPFDIDGGPGR